MNKRIISFLASVAAFLTLLGGLDLSGFITLLPDDVATGFATALPLLAGITHLVKTFGDFADDGKINGSFRLLPFLLLLGAVMLLNACAALGSAATGQPIPATPVQREKGKPFNVATIDVQRAEASPPATVWGLYNAGAFAETARAVAIQATK